MVGFFGKVVAVFLKKVFLMPLGMILIFLGLMLKFLDK